MTGKCYPLIFLFIFMSVLTPTEQEALAKRIFKDFWENLYDCIRSIGKAVVSIFTGEYEEEKLEREREWERQKWERERQEREREQERQEREREWERQEREREWERQEREWERQEREREWERQEREQERQEREREWERREREWERQEREREWERQERERERQEREQERERERQEREREWERQERERQQLERQEREKFQLAEYVIKEILKTDPGLAVVMAQALINGDTALLQIFLEKAHIQSERRTNQPSSKEIDHLSTNAGVKTDEQNNI